MFISKITATASLIVLAMANPFPDADSKLAKRAEGIHLVNCGARYSAVVYCPNDGNCNFNPGSGNQCLPTKGGIATWEGSNQRCTFPGTGVTFSWNVESKAQSGSNYTKVGTGDNGFQKFNIFKDDQHLMYTDGNGNPCRSIYYALDA